LGSGVHTILLGFKHFLESVQVLVLLLKFLQNLSGALQVAPHVVQGSM